MDYIRHAILVLEECITKTLHALYAIIWDSYIMYAYLSFSNRNHATNRQWDGPSMYHAFNERVETFSHNTLRDFPHVSKHFEKASFLVFFPKFTDSGIPTIN
jgi:hypothetical protein